ncbi:uncharacterized protein [Pempheris klunzingeri]|uniref:uncharacterized protein n=1 Tax=Pempheris klunzingeri TaxID=3127111 RepID=UPI00397F6293
MSAVNILFVSSEDFKLSKAEILRGIVTEKLTTAAREILAVVERTVAGYEEEAAGLRREVDRQRRQLEALLQPRVTLCRIEDPVCDEEEGGRLRLLKDEEQQTHLGSWGHIEEEEGEEEEEPAQSHSPGPVQEDLTGRRTTNTRSGCEDVGGSHVQNLDRSLMGSFPCRGPSVKMKSRRKSPLQLRVGLLGDSHTGVLTHGVLGTRSADHQTVADRPGEPKHVVMVSWERPVEASSTRASSLTFGGKS